MSREILLNDLRAKGEAQRTALWLEAQAEAERLRAEAAQRLTAELARCELAGDEVGRAVHRRRAMAARRQAGALIARADQELSDRLYLLARELLAGDWPADRPALLAELAAELPPGDWTQVRVNPADQTNAAQLFPRHEIVADPQVLGGLAVTNRTGEVTIDNTMNTRLVRIWSGLLPELLREVKDGALG